MNQIELAERSGISIATIRRIEGATDDLRVMLDTILRIQRALEAEGIVFIDSDGAQGFGVRLKDPDAK